MKKKNLLRQWYRNFKAWQIKPFRYKNKSRATHHCANCGTTFNDNFCPRCGQAAGVGRVNWGTIRYDLMEIWNIESRSLLTTLWQLFLRPGYLIDDYLRGKRSASYPPVKMLLVVAIAIDIIRHLFGIFPPHTLEVTDQTQMESFVVLYNRWATDNQGWAYLIQGAMTILPNWLIFRNSPRHHHHTLPEGFFIQAFICSLVLLINTFSSYLGKWFGFIIFVYYVLIFRRVFGYGIWGTIWRLILSIIASSFLIFIVLIIAEVLLFFVRG